MRNGAQGICGVVEEGEITVLLAPILGSGGNVPVYAIFPSACRSIDSAVTRSMHVSYEHILLSKTYIN